ncbi:AIPR family protein [Leifsonia sp. A12D58]|uniref:AIPR family protein n=1 Tax=Leifsonia sp. A12D58 TaxID=3397674 RepID=UPI0039E18F14
MDIEAFYSDIRNAIGTRAAADNEYRSVAFMSEVADRLADAEEIEQLTVTQFEGIGSRNRRLAMNGFDLDDSDNSVALAVLAFQDSEELATLTMGEAKRAFAGLENFLVDATGGVFTQGREESSPAFQLAEDLYRRARNVTRYRLYLITDSRMSDRITVLPSSEVNGVRVEYHIWDIRRLHQVDLSNQGREELEIDLDEWIPGGLRVLEIAGQSNDFATYLAVIPGKVVADLYGRFGSRLLEGNVRSFLSARGKVNKGIKATVLSEPEMFLAYNNGITATAIGVTVSETGSFLTHIRDLQIVNGGQTTASLFYVDRENGSGGGLTDVYVQMKLVVVDPDKAVELVPNISRYANSQNKVSEADFSSNSGFHVRLEELSRRVLVPAQAGVHFQTKWFYERTRGQYLNEKNKLKTAAARQFVMTYPRNQLMTKTDAAKYVVSWAMKPHIVSAGAQKNFVAFAGHIESKWRTSNTEFNELYFKELVAKAILFNAVRGVVARAEWYQSGYLANIVTYTVAKLAFEIERQGSGNQLDFGEIWNDQALSPLLKDVTLSIAQQVFGVLVDPRRRVANVTEWAKNAECWNAVQTLEVTLLPEFLMSLIPSESQQEALRDAAATQRIDSGIMVQQQVMSISQTNWALLLAYGEDRKIVSPTDLGVLGVVAGAGVPSERQSRRLLDILLRARKHGFSSF